MARPEEIQRKKMLLLLAVEEISTNVNVSRIAVKTKINLFDYDFLDDLKFIEEVKYLKDLKKTRIENYVNQTVRRYQPDDFKTRFRMSRQSFEVLMDYIVPLLSVDRVRNSHIPYEKQLLTFLYYCGTQDSLIRIADVFGICEASVFNIIATVSQLVNKHLLKIFIKMPTGNQVQDVFRGFYQQQGFPKVIGALDGTHIPIKSPIVDSEAYINRKKYHSINVAAVCDHEMIFTNICVGWPGSTHDSRVFKNTSLGVACQDEEKMHKYFPENSHLLADSAYELNDYIMTPFRDTGALNRLEKDYNYKHSSTRMKIENAFGLFKGRFRRMKYIDMHRPQRLVDLITSCFIMHNICLLSSDTLDDYLNLEEDAVNNFEDTRENANPRESAVAKRRAIAILLSI